MARTATRSDVDRHISELALASGWRHHRARCVGRTRDGYADGFPLDVLVRAGRLVFIVAGSLTPAEHAWATELADVTTVEVFTVDRADLGPLGRMLASADEPNHRARGAGQSTPETAESVRLRGPPDTVAA